MKKDLGGVLNPLICSNMQRLTGDLRVMNG